MPVLLGENYHAVKLTGARTQWSGLLDFGPIFFLCDPVVASLPFVQWLPSPIEPFSPPPIHENAGESGLSAQTFGWKSEGESNSG